MKKKVTVLTFSARFFSALHSALCVLGAMLLALSFPAPAQQPTKKIPRIGILTVGSAIRLSTCSGKAFMSLVGWRDKTLLIEYRWADGNEERLPAVAAQLVAAKVDIVVSTSPRATHAARQLTKNIPIIETFVGRRG